MTRLTAIQGLLAAYKPPTPAERMHLAQILALVDDDDEAVFTRTHFAPGHLTASAFVTDSTGQQLLLIHHKKLSRWLQPGGHFEAGDADLLAAATREALEETGLASVEAPSGAALFDVDVHTIPAFGAEPEHRHFDLRVHLRAPKGATIGADAKWVALTTLCGEAPGVDTDESVLRAARKLTGPPR